MGATYSVKLHGGPRDNDVVNYTAPLPETLCVTEIPNRFTIKPTYHDYKYRSSKGCVAEYDWVGETRARTV